jgi:hypothetical protein
MAVAAVVSRLDVAGPGIMAQRFKGAADHAGTLAGDEEAAHYMSLPIRSAGRVARFANFAGPEKWLYGDCTNDPREKRKVLVLFCLEIPLPVFG